jgi:hypothetical protein
MKAYWGSEGITPHSLTLALDGCECSASCPVRFTSRERAPGIHCIGGWVGLRAGLDEVSKRKIPSPRRESNPQHPIIQYRSNTGGSSFFIRGAVPPLLHEYSWRGA